MSTAEEVPVPDRPLLAAVRAADVEDDERAIDHLEDVRAAGAGEAVGFEQKSVAAKHRLRAHRTAADEKSYRENESAHLHPPTVSSTVFAKCSVVNGFAAVLFIHDLVAPRFAAQSECGISSR